MALSGTCFAMNNSYVTCYCLFSDLLSCKTTVICIARGKISSKVCNTQWFKLSAPGKHTRHQLCSWPHRWYKVWISVIGKYTEEGRVMTGCHSLIGSGNAWIHIEDFFRTTGLCIKIRRDNRWKTVSIPCQVNAASCLMSGSAKSDTIILPRLDFIMTLIWYFMSL